MAEQNEAVVGDGTTKDAPQFLDKEMMTRKVVLKADGVETEMTVEEAVARAQTAAASHERMRKAATTEEAAKTAMLIQEDMQAGLAKGDSAAMIRAFRNSGATEEQLAALFNPSGTTPNPESQGGEDEGGLDDGEGAEEMPVWAKKQLAEQAVKIEQLEKVQEGAKAARRDREVQGVIDTALDRDTELSKVMENMDVEGRAWLRRLSYSAVAEASRKLPWGPRAVQQGLDDFKSHLKKVGVVGAKDYPSGGPTPGFPGLGPAGLPVGSLHQSSGDEDKVPVQHPEYGFSIMKRLAKKLKG